ncbi:MAG: hypothetical protein ABH842_06110 [Candidatus Micrarchaeota archaeon]
MDYEIISFYVFGSVILLLIIFYVRGSLFKYGSCSGCPSSGNCIIEKKFKS